MLDTSSLPLERQLSIINFNNLIDKCGPENLPDLIQLVKEMNIILHWKDVLVAKNFVGDWNKGEGMDYSMPLNEVQQLLKVEPEGGNSD